MTETEKNAILEELRGQMTGELLADLQMLEAKAAEYGAKENGAEIANAIADFAVSLMPKEHMDFMKQKIYIGERRMDAVYAEASALMQKRQYDKAVVLTGQIYEKIRAEYVETEDARIFSFRNLLESNLYYLMYHPTKRLEKAPFDFVRYLMAHAFNLVEVRRPSEAIEVLETAIRFNPVCPDPRFELAEIYKLMHEHEKLLTVIRETLPVCATPYALSRCYANLGYYCVDIKEYEKAICFYFESLIYTHTPAIRAELMHVSQMMGERIRPPKRAQVLEAFESLEMPNGPDTNVLHVANVLGEQAMQNQDWENACFYLRVFADLTNDDNAKKLFADCQEKLKAQRNAE